MLNFVTGQGWGFSALLVLAATGCIAGLRRLPMFAWLPASCGLLLVLHTTWDWMPRYQLFVPIMPFLFILVGYGFAELLQRVRCSRVLIGIWCLAFAASLTEYARHQMFAGYARAIGNLPTQTRSWNWFVSVAAQLPQRANRVEGTAWKILRQIPAGETICIRDIGFVGFLTDNPIWDLAGLITPTVARARLYAKNDRPRRSLVVSSCSESCCSDQAARVGMETWRSGRSPCHTNAHGSPGSHSFSVAAARFGIRGSE